MHQKNPIYFNIFILLWFVVLGFNIIQKDICFAQPPGVTKVFDESQGRWVAGGTIEGWVRNSSNKGLSDVCITAFFTPCGELKQQIVCTQHDGSFRFTGLLPHVYYLYADTSCRSSYNLVNIWWNGESGTTDCSKAASISIQDGELKSNIIFKLLPGKKIKGQVVNQNGQPVLDACVVATDYCAKKWYSGVNTNSNGFFALMGLEPTIYFLHINPDCGANKRIKESLWWSGGNQVTTDCNKAVSISMNASSPVSEITFNISIQPELKGAIVDDKQKPVVNACVNIRKYCEKEWLDTAITDKNGFYSFSQLPEGRFYLETSVSCQQFQQYIDVWWNHTGGDYLCQNAEPVTMAASFQTYDFTLTTGNVIRGKVLQKDKRPVPDVCVLVSNQCKKNVYDQTITNEKGIYHLVLPDGLYYLYSNPSCDSQNNLVSQWWNGRSGTQNCLDASGIQLTNKQVKKHMDFSLQTGGNLKGSILSNIKKPLPNACIAITKNCDQPFSVIQQTDGDGNFMLKLLAGSYYVRTDYSCNLNPSFTNKQNKDVHFNKTVFMDQWWGKTKNVSYCKDAEPVVIQSDKQTDPIHFVLSPGGIISGRVMSVEGKAISNIVIRLYDKSGQSIILSVMSQPDGTFRTMLPSGTYFIRALPSRSRTYNYYIDQWWNAQTGSVHVQGAKPLMVKNNEEKHNILFKLKKGGAVTGMIFSPGQKPIENINVVASDPQKDIQWSFATTNVHGQYMISGIPEGLQTISVDYKSLPQHMLYHWSYGAIVEHSIHIDTGKIKHIDPFILPKGGAISGHIYTKANEPIPDVCVVAVQQCGNQYFGQAKTNEQGKYLIKGLPPGNYYVQTNISCKEFPEDYLDIYWTEKNGTPVCTKAKPIQVHKKQTTSDIDFSLSKDISFVGTVLTVSGNPIENVCVIVSDQCGSEWLGEALTDDRGEFTITGIPPGSWFLHTEVSCYKDQPYSDLWWHSIENTTDCKDAEPVVLSHSNMKIPVQFSLMDQSAQVFDSEAHAPLAEGHFDEVIDNGKVVITIKDNLLDVIVEAVPLENVLQVISKYTGIKVLLFGTLKDKIYFDKRQAKLDEILLDLINGRAGHIFIYSPDRLMTSYIFSKDGQLKPTTLSANTTAVPPFQLNVKKSLSIMKPQEIEDILTAPGRVEEKIHTLGELIGYFDSQNALHFLNVALQDADEEVRMMAISVMNDLKENHLAVNDLTSALDRDLSPAVRALAAEALGEIGDKRAVRSLMEALNDRDAGVRDTVQRALHAIQGRP